MMIIHPYFTAFVGFCLTLLMISALSKIAQKIHLVDKPTLRKQHEGSIPLIGGIAISISFMISILALNVSLSPFRALFAGFLLLVIVGVLDDFNEISARMRIITQALVGLLVTCWGGVLLTHLGGLFSSTIDFNLGNWAIPGTILCIMALINATNMLDGINGLAGGTSFITLACLAWIAHHSHAMQSEQLLLVLCACVFGFLCFNFPIGHPQKRLVFLGDAGSTSLGLMIAWFGITLSQLPNAFLKPAYLPWLFIVPIFDLVSVTLRRVLIKKTSAFTADREHIHHLLEAQGLSQTLSTIILILCALVGGLTAILMAQYHYRETTAFNSFIFLLLIYFTAFNYYWRKHHHIYH